MTLVGYHRVLLSDQARVSAFHEAIRTTVKPGDVVVDLGSGSGILSFFACAAGASKVYAIEQNHMADVTQLLARHLGFGERITVIHEEAANVELPERADVLITETLGSFGVDEQILGFVLDARARMLRPGAPIIPRHLALMVVPAEVPEHYNAVIGWWSERRYGFDLAPLRAFASNSVLHLNLAAEAHLAAAAQIIEADLMTIDTAILRGRATYTAHRDGLLHGFGLWFTATLTDDITLSNGGLRATNWSQGLFPLPQPVAVTAGARIELELETNDGETWRWRGTVADTPFDQTTAAAMPRCAVDRHS